MNRSFLSSRIPSLDRVQSALSETLPENVGWTHTLGSVLIFLLLLQLGTGAVLALYYVPAPDYAWQSRTFLSEGSVVGRALISIHHWGSSLLVVVAVLHLLRVVLHGAYRAPRELNWVSGIALLMTILAFSITGFLLPWDQQGYWATVVGIQIVESIPLIGHWLAYLLQGGQEIGAPTLTRFYALHIILLPLMTFLLVIFHLYLLRVHRTAPPPRHKEPAPVSNQSFFPYQMSRDGASILATLAIIVFLALISPYGGEPPADPLGTSYNPRPEWFLLAQYELLRISGSYIFWIAILIPAVVLVVLTCIPFLDRSETSWYWKARKKVVIPVFVLVALLLVATVWSRLYHPGVYGEEVDVDAEDLLLPHSQEKEREILKLGRETFVREECVNCHRVGELGGETGPALTSVEEHRSRDFIRRKIVDPRLDQPLSPMPEYGHLNQPRLEAVVEYVWRIQAAHPSEGLENGATRPDN